LTANKLITKLINQSNQFSILVRRALRQKNRIYKTNLNLKLPAMEGRLLKRKQMVQSIDANDYHYRIKLGLVGD